MRGILDRAAGAPITWGVCEAPGWGVQLPAARVLGEMRAVGLGATELGPPGFLPGESGDLRALLDAYGLRLVAGFVPIVLHDPGRIDAELEKAAAAVRLLAGGGAGVLVLAAALPRAGYESSSELDDVEWKTLADSIERVSELAGELGLRVALHPHHGTAIEGPGEVARLLEVSPVGLCLDTGHLLVGGTDPVELVRQDPSRVTHVHLKDVDAGWAGRVRARSCGYAEAVRGGLYRPLGTGDVGVAEIVRTLEASGYEGWYVLEQDTVLDVAPEEGEGPIHAASASLDFLRGMVPAQAQGSRQP